MIKTTNESSICLTCDKDIYKKHYNDTEIKTHKQTWQPCLGSKK